MADSFDDQRFRNEVEALALAICGIRRHAVPDRQVLDVIIEREVDRVAVGSSGSAWMLDPETVSGLVQALADWRDRVAEDDVPESSG